MRQETPKEILILDKAKERLITRGWIKGTEESVDGICLGYALNISCDEILGEDGRLSPIGKSIWKTVASKTQQDNVVSFNDADDTTLNDVFDVIAEARKVYLTQALQTVDA